MNRLEELKNTINKKEQRIFIKFSVLLGHSSGIIHNDLVGLVGSDAYKLNSVKNLVTRFKQGENAVKDRRGGDRSNRLKKERIINDINDLLAQTRAWSCLELSKRVKSSKSTVQRYLSEELQMKKLLSKWVPHLLTEEQREHRILACENNIEQLSKDNSLINRTLAIDETWVSLDMVLQRDQSRTWRRSNEKPPEVVRKTNSQRKRMLILAMDSQGAVYWKLCGNKETINSEVYKNFLMELLEVWLPKKGIKVPIVLHDNARPHKSDLIKEFFRERKIRTWYHPPYSPDISPPDFNCFGQLKKILRGNAYTNWREFEVVLENAINELNIKGQMKGIQQLPEKWKRVIDAEGQYL